MAMILLILGGLLLGGIAGFAAGRLAARSPGPPPETDNEIRLRRQVQELSAELQKTAKERAGDLTIASQIPIIVRRLGERLSPNAIPGIAVRTTKEIFRTPVAGFFAFRKEEGGFHLVCGVGFPDEWKGKRTFSSTEGILGTASQQQIVVTKEDYLAGMRNWPLPPGTLEEAGILPDLVAPVVWGGNTYGALVLSGSAEPLGGKRPYASMLADMVASAFQNSIAVEAADLEASTDSLTGLYNRAYLARRFETELRRARNYMAPLSVLILDIDHFKKVNDTYGHPAGDAILKKLAEIIRKFTRASDFVVRYGGEEFVVVMTASNQDQAIHYIEQLREKVAATQFAVPGHVPTLKVTISAGVSSFPEDGQSTADLLKAADQALYAAKAGGRNRVVRAARVGLDGKPF
jgi:diguanylate cyclase (GGDEF)-like protein